jgi:hypothetical protein
VTMIRNLGFALVALAVCATSTVWAGENKDGGKGCCATAAANNGDKMCDLSTLALNDEQKGKLEAWQTECMKGGCTKESRHKFMQQAKGILTAEQFAKLKAECKKTKEKDANKTET